jgi:hyperosmotically inducible protein
LRKVLFLGSLLSNRELIVEKNRKAKEGVMRKGHLVFVSLFIVLTMAISMGCGTIYKTARDERSMGTIMDDKTIEGKIKKRMIDDELVKALDISVYCFTGKVFLVGLVEKSAQKTKAVQIAKGVEGVKSVRTYILEKGKDRTTGKSVADAKITAKVKARLIGDMDLKATQIEVKTLKGHVVLLGIVLAKQDINKAIAHAKKVEGVRKVKSFVMTKH